MATPAAEPHRSTSESHISHEPHLPQASEPSAPPRSPQDAARWEHLQELFFTVTSLPAALGPEARREHARSLCASDPSLLPDLLALLAEDDRRHTLLDGGLDQAAGAVIGNPALSLLVERQIGPYRLLEVLGEGGMGVVYLAERTDIGGRVAIKLLRDAWLSPMRLERFALEQRTLARLNHPAIARVYDSGALADGTPWFVMEYAEGQDLAGFWTARQGSARECLALFRRVCEAVQYAHSHAVIHRDLKPSNIIVGHAGEVKLLDFGISKQMDALPAGPDTTRTALRLLTPGYAAPEQHTGETVGVFTDVYSLGVLLYELLTAHLPRPRTTAAEEAAAFTGPVTRPSELVARTRPAQRSGLSRSEWADLDILCLTALQTDPARRYRSVDALILDIDNLLGGRPLQARPDTFLYTAGKFVRRNRRTLLAVAAMLVLLVSLVTGYSIRLRNARNLAGAEASRARRQAQFTEDLFDGGDLEGGPQRNLDINQLLERGRKQADSLGDDSAMQADMRETIGGIYQKLGRFSDADPLLESAAKARQDDSADQHFRLAGSLIVLAQLRRDESRLDEAERLSRAALAAAGNDPLGREAGAQASRVLGNVLALRGRYTEARGVLEKVISRDRRSAVTREETTRAEAALSDVLFYQGDYDSAERLNQQVLLARRRYYGERHPAIADTLNNLGSIASNRGQYARAESFFREGILILEGWYGPSHPEVAANLTQLATVVDRQGHTDEARGMLERALSIDRATYGNLHPRVALALNQLGVFYNGHDQYSDAERVFTQALDMNRQVYGEQHSTVATAYSNLAGVFLNAKKYPRAEEMCRKALSIFQNTLTAQHPSTAIAEVKLGRILVREGRFTEAEPHTSTAYVFFSTHPADASYLRGARKDLAAIYTALGEPGKASRYIAELSQSPGTPPSTSPVR